MASYPFAGVQDTDRAEKPVAVKADYVPPPPRALNGGLFTGEPFAPGAPWANVPVVPDVDYMTNINLQSANPPARALYQYPGNTRPGNNWQRNTGLQPYQGPDGFELPYNFSCTSCQTLKPTTPCKCQSVSYISGNSVGKCTCDTFKVVEV